MRKTWIYVGGSRNGMTVSSRLDTPRFYPLRNFQIFNHSFLIFMGPNGQWAKVFL